jgi:hypothetical protein
MRYYYYVDRGFNCFNIGWTYDPLDFNQSSYGSSNIVEIILKEKEGSSTTWVCTPLSSVFEEKQPFMKINSNREYRIDEILES